MSNLEEGCLPVSPTSNLIERPSYSDLRATPDARLDLGTDVTAREDEAYPGVLIAWRRAREKLDCSRRRRRLICQRREDLRAPLLGARRPHPRRGAPSTYSRLRQGQEPLCGDMTARDGPSANVPRRGA